MLTARKLPDKEAHLLVPELNVSTHLIAVVSAPYPNRLKPGSLHVLKHEVLVVVLAVDNQLHLDKVAALQGRAALQLDPLELLDLLIKRLTA